MGYASCGQTSIKTLPSHRMYAVGKNVQDFSFFFGDLFVFRLHFALRTFVFFSITK